MTNPELFAVDALLDDKAKDIIVCCGAGGVGKTTTAAALGLRAAERGRHVVVLTIDPARRLAQSLGLAELDNTPRVVAGVGEAAGGSLSAMMLDMKRTFDDVVRAHASPEKAEGILQNPFYIKMSSSFAGTSEYMAMEKLGQLRAQSSVPGGSGEHPWDLIVVDTPPSRSALDFLDAPGRLSSFLDGRFIRVLTAPARAGGRLGIKTIGTVIGGASGIMAKLLGQQTLDDVQTFVAAMDSMFGGFRERAEHTFKLLKGAGTSFVVVASPDPDALREAEFFVDRLADDAMPLAGLVLNRMTQRGSDISAMDAWAAAEQCDDPLVATLLQVQGDLSMRIDAEENIVAGFVERRSQVPIVRVPLRATDVFDIEALHAIGTDLGVSAVDVTAVDSEAAATQAANRGQSQAGSSNSE